MVNSLQERNEIIFIFKEDSAHEGLHYEQIAEQKECSGRLRKALKVHKCLPYRIQILQELHEDDFDGEYSFLK